VSDTFISLKNYYDRQITIDDPDANGVPLPICIRRFTIEQLQEFSIRRQRCEDNPADRMVYRKPDCDEQEKEPVTWKDTTVMGPFRVPDSEVRRRRLAEMSDEERAEFHRRREAHEALVAEFHRDTIREHVWLKPGVRVQFTELTGEMRELATGEGSGADLLKVFGGNVVTMRAMADAVYDENMMSAESKKKSRLLSDSTLFSPPKTPTADGDAPDATAGSVETLGSAGNGAATGSHGPIPSGSTATTKLTPARSSRSRQTSSNSSRVSP
jgi:hypothetical protein